MNKNVEKQKKEVENESEQNVTANTETFNSDLKNNSKTKEGIFEDSATNMEKYNQSDSVMTDAKVTDKKQNMNDTKPIDFEDDGEDLPDNFFDDFSNKDFMAGLDIIDDSIDDDISPPPDEIKKAEKTKRDYHKKSPRRPFRERRYEDNYRDKRRSKEDDRYFKDYRKRRSHSRHKRRSHSKYCKTSQGVNVVGQCDKIYDNDCRRDPEKTKRDIERDKIRCAKDQEARIFKEQLKIAETGLVPPGTELDVVLNSNMFRDDIKSNSSKNEVKTDKVDDNKETKYVHDKKRSYVETQPYKKPDKFKIEKRPRSRSRQRHSRDSPVRKYRRSRSRLDRDRSYSSKRRRRSSRSYEREYRVRERRDSRDVDLRYRICEKRERLLHELSPVSDRRISRSPSLYNISPNSIMSERENWLRSKERQGRRRYSRSCSPISSNSMSERDRMRSPRLRRSRKFSFIEEIQLRQTNASTLPQVINMPSNTSVNQTPRHLQPLMSIPIPNPNTQEYYVGSQTNTGFNSNSSYPTMVPPPEPFAHSMMPHLNSNALDYPLSVPNQSVTTQELPLCLPQTNMNYGVPQISTLPIIGNDNGQTNSNVPIYLQEHRQDNMELAKVILFYFL